MVFIRIQATQNISKSELKQICNMSNALFIVMSINDDTRALEGQMCEPVIWTLELLCLSGVKA